MSFDGNYNEVVEEIVNSGVNQPTSNGINLFNIRLKDEEGNWGPLFKKVVLKAIQNRSVEINTAEYFWGLQDPGVGNGTTILSFDGNYNEVIETLSSQAIYSPGPGLNVFNIRLKDEEGRWGPKFKKVVNIQVPLFENIDILNISQIDTICKGDTVELELYAGFNPEWFPSAYVDSSFTENIYVFPEITTEFILVAENSLGIRDTVRYTIYVDNYNVSAGNDLNICENDSVVLSGSGASTYFWDNGIVNGQAFLPTSSGSYILSAYNNRGCLSKDTINVNINIPNINPGNNQAICLNDSISLNASGVQNYFWENGVNNGDYITPNQTNYYVVSGFDQYGCNDLDSVLITVNGLPNVTTVNDQNICSGSTITLLGSGADSYVWDNGVTNNVPFSINATTTFTVTGSDLNGCIDTSQVTFTVQPSPNINLSSNQTICLGDQVILDAIGANNISWNNGVSNTVPFYPTQSSYYTVSGDNSYGCVSEDSVLVTVNPLPNVNAGQDVNVCAGSASILIASGANNYVWNNNIINGQSFIPSNTSSYIVIGTDNNGCVNSDTVIVTVNSLPNVIAGSDQTVCLGDDVTLSASGANSYSWTNGVVNNVAFVPTSPNPNFVSSVSYTVTGTDINGCTNTDIVLVTINPLPDIYAYSFVNGVNTNNPEVDLCSGDSVRLYGDGAGIGTYEWDNGVMDNEWFTPTNSNIYTLTGTRDFTGCSNTDQITLTVNELPEIVETIINEEFGDDGSISIDVIAGTPPFDFDWDVDGLGDNDDFQDLTDLRGGTYVLIVIDDNGCKSRFTIVLENMNSLIIIPSALTPNGDGVNDVWDIKGLNDYPEMQLQIFDRNGMLLHEQQGLYTDWDGIYAGKQLPEGDYFYIIDLKNGRKPYMGAVSIKF